MIVQAINMTVVAFVTALSFNYDSCCLVRSPKVGTLEFVKSLLVCGSQTITPAWEEQAAQNLADSTGLSFSEARALVRTAVEAAQENARREGTERLPLNYGDLLLEKEHLDPTLKKDLARKRQEGVTNEDIRQYWNMNDLERRTLKKLAQALLYATWKRAVEAGRSDEQAAVYARKYYPYYGDPDDTRVTSGDDRPLPNELMMRDDAWFDQLMSRSPALLKQMNDRGAQQL